jgi:hypothetical protein
VTVTGLAMALALPFGLGAAVDYLETNRLLPFETVGID